MRNAASCSPDGWQDALIDAWCRGGRRAARAMIRADRHFTAIRAAGGEASETLPVFSRSAADAERVIAIATRLRVDLRGKIERARRRHDERSLDDLRRRMRALKNAISLARSGDITGAQRTFDDLMRPAPAGDEAGKTGKKPARPRERRWVVVPDPGQDWPEYRRVLEGARALHINREGTTYALTSAQ